MLGIYIHIPFCEKKCNYCAFSSFVNLKEEKDRYIEHLLKEIDNFDYNQLDFNENLILLGKEKDTSYKVDTIYIGGGTPSLLNLDDLTKILKKIKEKFEVCDNCEITIECNPNSMNIEKAKGYINLGINRISIGIQSLDDSQLNFIGRLHNSNQALNAIEIAKESGFSNISVDMIIGLKNQSSDTFIKELKKLIEKGVNHISTYLLQIEDNTPLKDFVKNNPHFLPDEDECMEIFNEATKFLKKELFLQYEVSNFAKSGYESRHNFKYWTGENYKGFGLSAHSYINGIRYANSSTFKSYYAKEQSLKEKLTIKELIEEHVMLGFRCRNGIDIKYLEKLGYNIEENKDIDKYNKKNILIRKSDKIYLNSDYYGINNYIIIKFLPN